MGKKEGAFYLLELKVQWGNQTIINYTNKYEVAPGTSVIDDGTVVLRVHSVLESGPHQGDQGRLPGGSAN